MKNIKTYSLLALKDVFRLWSATQLQVIVIAGICLPILLLLGLKNGHVTELREELASSPTGRQIIFWSSGRQNFLSAKRLQDLQTIVPNTELIIPESQRVVFVDPKNEAKDESKENDVPLIPMTLYSTVQGDPILAQFNAELSSESDRHLILSAAFARELNLATGDTLPLTIMRKNSDGDKEKHTINFEVKQLLTADETGEGSAIGFAHIDTMDHLARYATGQSVPLWGIPSMKNKTAYPKYEEMLCFCLPDDLLTEDDQRFLQQRALKVSELNDPQKRLLFDQLNESAIDKTVAYQVERLDRDTAEFSPIRVTAYALGQNTEAVDDCFINWPSPQVEKIDGNEITLIGITVPTVNEFGGWLNSMLSDNADWFSEEEGEENPFQIKFLDEEKNARPAYFSLALDGEVSIKLTNANRVANTKPTDQQTETIPSAPQTENPELDATTPAFPDGETDIATPSTEQPSYKNDTGTLNTPQPETGPDLIPRTEQRLAVVPDRLLSFLNMYRAGIVDYDSQRQAFVTKDRDIVYTKAKLYTKTIDGVPKAVDALAQQNFAVLSENSRIAEIHEQDRSLQLLVLVVALGVFLFGVITVFSVLVDSTERKRGTVGILRVMGISQKGIFYIVLFRALTIGLFAALGCSFVGIALAYVLGADLSNIPMMNWKPDISVLIKPTDYMWVSLGAITCASLGAIIPAIKASQLDPFEAIMQGRFQ